MFIVRKLQIVAICSAWLLGANSSFAQDAKAKPETKLAVVDVGAKERAPAAFIDLLTVAFSKQSTIALLERADIDRLLREQALSLSLSNPIQSEAAVKAGKLWAVDAFLMLEAAKTPKGPVRVRIRLVDAHHGMKVLDANLLLEADGKQYPEQAAALAKLLDAARQGPKVLRCLPGLDRHFLYLTAAATGFRVSELASMTPESFNLDGDTPTATVQASCTKNRKLAVQPLPLDVANVLREYLADKPAGVPLWPDNPTAPTESWRRHAAEMIRGDLKEARTKWLQSFHDDAQRAEAERSDFLAYRDAEGRYADFHALRHSFITMVGNAGVSPREHQDLARHSTYALTSKYSHSRFYDLAAAVQGLPIQMTGPGTQSQELAATGTDGRQKKLSLKVSPQTAISADFGGQPRTEATQSEGEGNREKIKESLTFPAFSEDKKKLVREYPQGDSNRMANPLENREFLKSAAQNPAHFLPIPFPSTLTCSPFSTLGRPCQRRSRRAFWP